jgi:hypothetical protein
MTTGQPQPGWYADPAGKPGAKKYWDGKQWRDSQPATTGVATAPAAARTPARQTPVGANTQAHAGTNASQQPGNPYVYKNPVLYGFGGLFFPPLVLFLMGGNRTTGLWIIGLWVLFWLTVWFFGIGAIFAVGAYVWSVMACYQEANKQNLAHGLGQPA